MTTAMTAIGVVRGGRVEAVDDDWAAVEATIVLDPQRLGADALAGLSEFSHLEVVYIFHLVSEADIERGSRHPRGNLQWPRVGILAQRAKNRPNRLGVSRCELLGVDGHCLTIRGLDAIDGTPVLDIKPWMAEFAPQQPTRQPSWSSELMTRYWVLAATGAWAAAIATIAGVLPGALLLVASLRGATGDPRPRRPVVAELRVAVHAAAHSCTGTREHFGCGPASARAYIGEDILVCVPVGVYTQVERTLIDLGKTEIVRETRPIYQRAVEEQYVQIVQRITGREVTGCCQHRHL